MHETEFVLIFPVIARPNQFGMPGIVPPYVSAQMLNIPQTPLQAKHVASILCFFLFLPTSTLQLFLRNVCRTYIEYEQFALIYEEAAIIYNILPPPF